MINYIKCIKIYRKKIGSTNKLYGVDYKKFISICKDMVSEEKNINPELNTTTKRFIMIVRDNPVGEVGIRTTLNDFWINKGSQKYYKIRKSERGKGYGNTMLQLDLVESKKMGFDKIRVNCDNNNIASKKLYKIMEEKLIFQIIKQKMDIVQVT